MVRVPTEKPGEIMPPLLLSEPLIVPFPTTCPPCTASGVEAETLAPPLSDSTPAVWV